MGDDLIVLAVVAVGILAFWLWHDFMTAPIIEDEEEVFGDAVYQRGDNHESTDGNRTT